MKLYIYDHCPYCVRVRMLAGLRHLSIEEIILLNDDEHTPISMIGAKQLPIIQKSDGTYLGESLDIVNYLNELTNAPPLDSARAEIEAWLESANHDVQRLVMPRSVQLELAEFATESATNYYIDKKQQQIGDFAEHMQQTDEYLSNIHQHLNTLNQLAQSEQWLNGKQLSMEDILIFPILRNLTMVRGLILPEKLRHYVNHMAEQSSVHLYFNRAI